MPRSRFMPRIDERKRVIQSCLKNRLKMSAMQRKTLINTARHERLDHQNAAIHLCHLSLPIACSFSVFAEF